MVRVSASWWVRMCAAVLMVAFGSGCIESVAPAMLVETSDPVTVNGKSVHVLPTAPLALAAGDALEVGPKGLARLLYPDGSRFMLLPRGSDAGSLEVTPRGTSAAPVVVKLVRGVLAFLVPKERKVKDKYELKALNTVTTIEGTAGRVITTPTEDRVALEHGTVSVTAGSGATRINGLQEAVYAVATKVFSVQSYDPTGTTERDLYADPQDRTIQNH